MFATKVMANELSTYNIRVNSVAPSATDTDMLNQMETNAKEKLLKDSLLIKPISVDVIAEKVLFLASEKSQHLNGQIIKIDGRERH
jgi:NAD(P)-dependent dehydrogenase (short-subunit alcohol dehydrogenase family)